MGLQAQMEDGQGDWRQEDGGATLSQVERDGGVQLPAAAAARVRHIQELRGPLARRVHGRQRRGDAGQGHRLRAKGGGGRRWQEEVSGSARHTDKSRVEIICDLVRIMDYWASAE